MDDKELVGLCTSCGIARNEQWLEKNPFVQAGQDPPCGTCGGVIVICYKKDAKTILESEKSKRGI